MVFDGRSYVHMSILNSCLIEQELRTDVYKTRVQFIRKLPNTQATDTTRESQRETGHAEKRIIIMQTLIWTTSLFCVGANAFIHGVTLP